MPPYFESDLLPIFQNAKKGSKFPEKKKKIIYDMPIFFNALKVSWIMCYINQTNDHWAHLNIFVLLLIIEPY